ncbi:cysteine desulfurase family protein [Treponema pectinovorum]|uniref:cysteine desulfurase family protein n=1 Tax=Treponema pectinovorum TaxID=164 RepID=UPI0011F188F3|nr:cysteine desulfurase family protein [Treponema pectinovorum]
MDTSKYFDWAATSPCDKEILKDAFEKSLEFYANPSALHSEGQKAREVFEQARILCAKSLGVKPEEVFFTSGGTESDHIPLLSFLNREVDSQGFRGEIIISAIEHPALKEECELLKKQGFSVISVNPDKNGFISAQQIASKINSKTLYICVMAINNETGCIQPIYEIADKISEVSKGKRRPHFHVDAVQAAGKIPLDLSYPGIDSAALSAHKIGGPRGIGVLVLKKNIKPFLTGGGQEKNIRSGTENLFGAIAFSKCLEKYYIQGEGQIAPKDKTYEEKIALLKKQEENAIFFIDELSKIQNCTIVPALRADTSLEIQKRFSPYVIQASFKGIPGKVMLRALDAKGYSISTGSACSAKKQNRPVLAAMNASQEIQDTAVRFSFGHLTNRSDIEGLLNAIKEIYKDFF